MRALVTGGNGHLGYNLVKALSTLRGKRFNVNNRRAREVLGWAPKISLEQSLRDTMAAIRAARAAHLTGERS